MLTGTRYSTIAVLVDLYFSSPVALETPRGGRKQSKLGF